MPDDVKTIEKIVNSNGGANDIAAKLEVEKDVAEHLLSSYLVAKKLLMQTMPQIHFGLL